MKYPKMHIKMKSSRIPNIFFVGFHWGQSRKNFTRCSKSYDKLRQKYRIKFTASLSLASRSRHSRNNVRIDSLSIVFFFSFECQEFSQNSSQLFRKSLYFMTSSLRNQLTSEVFFFYFVVHSTWVSRNVSYYFCVVHFTCVIREAARKTQIGVWEVHDVKHKRGVVKYLWRCDRSNRSIFFTFPSDSTRLIKVAWKSSLIASSLFLFAQSFIEVRKESSESVKQTISLEGVVTLDCQTTAYKANIELNICNCNSFLLHFAFS